MQSDLTYKLISKMYSTSITSHFKNYEMEAQQVNYFPQFTYLRNKQSQNINSVASSFNYIAYKSYFKFFHVIIKFR